MKTSHITFISKILTEHKTKNKKNTFAKVVYSVLAEKMY